MSTDEDEYKITQQKASNRPTPIALGINVEKPKFPQYATLSSRLESFKEWDQSLPVTAQLLSEAGLVYTGIGDSVRCYFCGGGLRSWEYGDIPMEEHAKWYPTCPHVILVKGQTYVDRVTRGERPDLDKEDNVKGSLCTGKIDHLESDAAMSCIDMGYPKDMVKRAIDIYIQKHGGGTDFKGEDLCNILFDIEDSVYEPVLEEMVQECSIDENEQIEPLESLLEENQKLKESKSCKICLDNNADVIFLPCGHMVCCPQCAPAMTLCPICRQNINGHLKALFATTKAANLGSLEN